MLRVHATWFEILGQGVCFTFGVVVGTESKNEHQWSLFCHQIASMVGR
jgi:hypothetical protein